jgi:hypothetical protein
MNTEILALLIAGIGAIIAIWGVVTQRVLARRQATVTHISSLLNDHDYIKARMKFIKVAKSPLGLLPYAADEPFAEERAAIIIPPDETDEEKQVREACELNRIKEIDEIGSAIALVLNNYELISIGIQRGILDYVITRRYMRAIIIKHYSVTDLYINHLRTERNNPKYFSEFETMKNWMSDEKVKPNGRFWSLFF